MIVTREPIQCLKPYILGHDNEPDEEDLAIETIRDAYEKIHRSHKNVNAFRLEFRIAS